MFPYTEKKLMYTAYFDVVRKQGGFYLRMITNFMRENSRYNKGRLLFKSSRRFGKNCRKIFLNTAERGMHFIYFFLDKFRRKNGRHIPFYTDNSLQPHGNLLALYDYIAARKLPEKYKLKISARNIYKKKYGIFS